MPILCELFDEILAPKARGGHKNLLDTGHRALHRGINFKVARNAVRVSEPRQPPGDTDRADHHVSQEHLKRYLCEFDFRYNYRVALGFTDMQRTELAAAGIYGKRLTYRRTGQQPNA
jgi:hypothetical protein